jgi:hypothetical protein
MDLCASRVTACASPHARLRMRVSACASPHARLRMRVSVEIFLLAHRVLGRRRRVKVVEEGVVVGIDEDLRAARVGLSSVGHRERAHRVRDLCT